MLLGRCLKIMNQKILFVILISFTLGVNAKKYTAPEIDAYSIAAGYGASWGGENATYHHNLFAHAAGRNPSVAGGDGPRTINMDPKDVEKKITRKIILMLIKYFISPNQYVHHYMFNV